MERVLDYYRGMPGIVRAEPMDTDISEKVLDLERHTRTQTDSEYENVGYGMVMKKKHRVCVFYTEDMPVHHHADLFMIDDDGNVMGRMLTQDEIAEFKDRDDLVWISKDFVMFPDMVGGGDGRFVLYPWKCPDVDRAAGCHDSIGASPALPADMLMKDRWSIPHSERIFSMVIGFDE